MQNMKLLIIIPAFNEEKNIVRVVEELKQKCPQYDYVVINDGSHDATSKVCREKGYNLISLPINLGLSGAFQTGMKYAYRNGYDCAIQYDGDGQHDQKYISQMADCMQNRNADIVIGSRYLEEGKGKSLRSFGNSVINMFIYWSSRKRIYDSTSGMRLYNRKIIGFYATHINYNPEPDTIAYLIRCGAKVEEIQVVMRERIAGKSYLHMSAACNYMINICSSILFMQWFRKKEKI